jgi:hypothetical protein
MYCAVDLSVSRNEASARQAESIQRVLLQDLNNKGMQNEVESADTGTNDRSLSELAVSHWNGEHVVGLTQGSLRIRSLGTVL